MQATPHTIGTQVQQLASKVNVGDPVGLIGGTFRNIGNCFKGYFRACTDEFTDTYHAAAEASKKAKKVTAEVVKKHGRSTAQLVNKTGDLVQLVKDKGKDKVIVVAKAAVNTALKSTRTLANLMTFSGIGSLVHLGLAVYMLICLIDAARMFAQKSNNKAHINIPYEDINNLGRVAAWISLIAVVPMVSSVARMTGQSISSVESSNTAVRALGSALTGGGKLLNLAHRGVFAIPRRTIGLICAPLGSLLGSYKFITQLAFVGHTIMNEAFVKAVENKSSWQNTSLFGRYFFRRNEGIQNNMNVFQLRATRMVGEERQKQALDILDTNPSWGVRWINRIQGVVLD